MLTTCDILYKVEFRREIQAMAQDGTNVFNSKRRYTVSAEQSMTTRVQVRYLQSKAISDAVQ